MAQPEIAIPFLCNPKLDSQGLLSRFLLIAPGSTQGTRFITLSEVQGQVFERLEQFHYWVETTLERRLPLEEGERNVLNPPKVPLSTEAQVLWVEFVNQVEAQLLPEGEMDPIRTFAAKLPEHAARIAAILQYASGGHPVEIGEAALIGGIQLAEHFAETLLKSRAATGGDPKTRLAQRVLDWLKTSWGHGYVSLPDIYQTGPSQVRSRDDALQAALFLVEHGWLIPVEGSVVINGKRRKGAYQVNLGGDQDV